jgi:hypothetical protein
MSKHTAPTIVIDQHRSITEAKWDLITLRPSADTAWEHWPLGTAQPRYSESWERMDEGRANLVRAELDRDGYVSFSWFEVPEYLRTWVIGYMVPTEWKTGLEQNYRDLTDRYRFWVKGTLPTQALDKQPEGAL